MRKIGPVHVAEPGLTAGRQVADEIQVNLGIFKITVHRKIRLFALFNRRAASLQQWKCIPDVFRVKSVVRLVF